MNDLISLVVVDQEPRVDSRLIAKQLGVKNINTRELIEQYLPDFEEFGLTRFETEVGKRRQGGGNPEKYYLLNEDQSYLLLTYAQNTEQARNLKKRLVRAFGEQRRATALPAVPTLPVLEASLVLAFNGLPIRFLIDETGHWQATYRDVATALAATKSSGYDGRQVLNTLSKAVPRAVIAVFLCPTGFAPMGERLSVRTAARLSTSVQLPHQRLEQRCKKSLERSNPL